MSWASAPPRPTAASLSEFQRPRSSPGFGVPRLEPRLLPQAEKALSSLLCFSLKAASAVSGHSWSCLPSSNCHEKREKYHLDRAIENSASYVDFFTEINRTERDSCSPSDVIR